MDWISSITRPYPVGFFKSATIIEFISAIVTDQRQLKWFVIYTIWLGFSSAGIRTATNKLQQHFFTLILSMKLKFPLMNIEFIIIYSVYTFFGHPVYAGAKKIVWQIDARGGICHLVAFGFVIKLH